MRILQPDEARVRLGWLRPLARLTHEGVRGAKPLGAEDYLALAHEVNTLILDRIPTLSPERRDVAKRFVTLIDALYETRTKLVASAAAQPQDLYVKGDGSFEFERCVSRLMEMRSHDYLAEARVA